MILDEIKLHSNGAQFRRADLHIHSFGDGGSYDVSDAGMTPEAIVDISIQENLQVIAVTDHNAIGNVSRAIKHANPRRRNEVLPGQRFFQALTWSAAIHSPYDTAFF